MMEKQQRDLKADLRLCKQLESAWAKVGNRPWLTEELYVDFAHTAREGWPHAIERAIKAEELAQELVEALRRYEEWEASLLLEDGVWERNVGLPVFTQELYDSWMEIQDVRNEALIKAEEVLGDE